MRYQRIIYESLNNIDAFTCRNFNFTNFKFIDLNKDVPESERSDFFINEIFPEQNTKQMREIYTTVLEVLFRQTPEDLPRAKSRYVFVKLFSRTYQVSMYFWLILIVYRVIERKIVGIFSNGDFLGFLNEK
jgi:cobalamin synthase